MLRDSTYQELWTSLRSKRFQSSYCAKVRAGAKKTKKETLATQANYGLNQHTNEVILLPRNVAKIVNSTISLKQ